MIILKIKGGLGNQLFQYATGRALSIHLDTELKLDLSFYENPQYSKVYRLDKFNVKFAIARNSEFTNLKNLNEVPGIYKVLKKLKLNIYPYFKKSHVIEHDVLKLLNFKIKPNCDYYIEGWLGNEKYFKSHREIILHDLKADKLLNIENLELQKEIKLVDSVAVHVRRGDYLSNTYFANIPNEYYHVAIKNASSEIKNPVFYFFSDDIAWAKEHFSKQQNIKFIENNSVADTFWSTTGDIADLMLMRTCKHQIIANSTFSWWGAWLNQNPWKKVFCPATWYTNKKAQKRFETKNIIPSEWIKIKF